MMPSPFTARQPWRNSALSVVLIIIGSAGVLFVAGIIAEVFAHATPIEGLHYDYLAFYAAGSLLLHGHPAYLYSPGALSHIEQAITGYPIGILGYRPFLNPPFVAVALAPLALASAATARTIALCANAALAAVLMFALCRDLAGRARLLATLALLATYPVYHALIEGQPSLIMLAGATLALTWARQHRPLASGAALGLLWIKPQLAILVLIGLCCYRQWRTAAGMVGALAALILVALPFTGTHIYLAYISYLTQAANSILHGAGALQPTVWEGSATLMTNLQGLFTALFGQAATLLVTTCTAISSILLLGDYWLANIRQRPTLTTARGRQTLAVGIILLFLINPHEYSQDAVLLLVGLPLLLPEVPQRLRLPAILALAVALDELGVDQFLPVHLFTLLLMGILLFVCGENLRGWSPPWRQSRLSRAAAALSNSARRPSP